MPALTCLSTATICSTERRLRLTTSPAPRLRGHSAERLTLGVSRAPQCRSDRRGAATPPSNTGEKRSSQLDERKSCALGRADDDSYREIFEHHCLPSRQKHELIRPTFPPDCSHYAEHHRNPEAESSFPPDHLGIPVVCGGHPQIQVMNA